MHTATPAAVTPDDMPPLKDLVPLSDFAAILGTNKTTVARWVTVGVKPGPIKLRAWLLSEWKTTEFEVRDFIRRRTAAKCEVVRMPPPANSKEIDKRLQAATAKLTAKGVRTR